MQKGAKPSKLSKVKKPAKTHKKERAYVIDTNVIMGDPDVIKKLKGRVFVPTTVLSELDKHKHGHSEKARAVREFARYIENNQDKVWFHNSERYDGTADEKIIESAHHLAELYDITMITNDILMGVLARAKSINVERYEVTEASADVLYKGVLVGEAAEAEKTSLIKIRHTI